MPPKRVLVVGGTGHFGQLLVDDLRRYTNCELIVAGRRSADLRDRASIEAALEGVAIAISAAGPFQTLPTTLVELCLRRQIHYIDLADDRNFVLKVRSLVAAQQGTLPAICPGWSTVCALSGLLARIGSAGSSEVESIYIHMAPGNRIPRSTGTIASLLHSVGLPFRVFHDGHWRTVRGWSNPQDFPFPAPVGRRRGYLIDVPDHEVFPELFNARTVEFRTGSELRILNLAVSSLSWFIKAGLIGSWVPWNRLFQRAAAPFRFLGHDWGGVGVEVTGPNGRRRVSVVADSGGQRIAVMPASVMTASLLAGRPGNGLMSPADWITPKGLKVECEKRGFRMIEEEF